MPVATKVGGGRKGREEGEEAVNVCVKGHCEQFFFWEGTRLCRLLFLHILTILFGLSMYS